MSFATLQDQARLEWTEFERPDQARILVELGGDHDPFAEGPVEQIAHAHGGKVLARSDEHTGTTFTVTLLRSPGGGSASPAA